MIHKLAFGRTGHSSSRVIFGAAAFGNVTQNEADRAMETLLQNGINHIDTAASYGDSELHIGPWMKNHRDDFFLATKTTERTFQKARDEIHQSLERLQTDYLDSIQLHALHDPDEWQTAMNDGGALQAAIEARENGLVRFIGVTGHGTTIAAMHQRSLERFAFDSVLLPYNFAMMQNPQYARDFEDLISVCQTREVAIQTIKSITRGPWKDGAQNRATWYEPLENPVEIDLAVRYVLSRENFFLNTAGDVELLAKTLKSAERFFSQAANETENLQSQDMQSQDMQTALLRLGLTPLFT